ncbi:MAG: hypothetical protein AAGI69_26700 [Cyanobacteria bacterium P01_H01_bin.21]
MDSHNRYKKEPPNALYPQEISLSETYRTLEGFDNPSIIEQSTSFSQQDFDYLKIVALKKDTKTVATGFFSIFCSLLLSSVLLGWTTAQLSISFQHLAERFSSYSIDAGWPSMNPMF